MRLFEAILPILFAGSALAGYGSPVKDDYEEGGYQAAPAPPSFNSGYSNQKSFSSGGYNAAPAPARPSFSAGTKAGGYSRPSGGYAAAPAPVSHQAAAGGGGYSDNSAHGPGEHWAPYNFAYTADNGEGTHSHSAQGDSQGRVQGEYSIQLADGRTRTVKYHADETGYHADIITNELGTESKNPADVTIQSSAITGEEAAQQYTPSQQSHGGSAGGYSSGQQYTPSQQSHGGSAGGYSSAHHTNSQSSYSGSSSFGSAHSAAPAVDHSAGYSGQADYSAHQAAAAPEAPRRRNKGYGK